MERKEKMRNMDFNFSWKYHKSPCYYWFNRREDKKKRNGKNKKPVFLSSHPPSPSAMDAPPMDDLGWYEARGQVYYPREATTAAAPILSHLPGPSWPPAPALGHSTQLAPVPFPAPSSSHLPYLPYSHSPDPCSASARSQVCDVYDPYDLQSRYDGYDPRYAHRHLAPDPGFHGMVASGVGEGQGFYAREAIRQFGMDPLAFEDVSPVPPSWELLHFLFFFCPRRANSIALC